MVKIRHKPSPDNNIDVVVKYAITWDIFSMSQSLCTRKFYRKSYMSLRWSQFDMLQYWFKIQYS